MTLYFRATGFSGQHLKVILPMIRGPDLEPKKKCRGRDMVATTGHRGPAFACVPYFRHFQKVGAPRPQFRIRISRRSRPKPRRRASAPETGDGETTRPETFGYLSGNIPVHYHFTWLSYVPFVSRYIFLFVFFSFHGFLLTHSI